MLFMFETRYKLHRSSFPRFSNHNNKHICNINNKITSINPKSGNVSDEIKALTFGMTEFLQVIGKDVAYLRQQQQQL